ncbi:MAG: hypothetical protein IKV94_02400 [Clostridia bacterium]|nr:hypothetical protein [Clostridia bacterium]
MELLKNLADMLQGANLNLLISIAATLVFLLLLILKGTILQTGIRIVTKRKIDFYFMVIPTFLAIIVNTLLLLCGYLVLTYYNIDILDNIINLLFHAVSDFTQIIYILLAFLGAEIIFILIQGVILKLIKFDIVLSIKKLIQKVSKKSEESQEQQVQLIEPEEEIDNSYLTGILSGLFCFAIMFFLTIILIYIGSLIGKNLF